MGEGVGKCVEGLRASVAQMKRMVKEA
jgi:hypothetical protein